MNKSQKGKRPNTTQPGGKKGAKSQTNATLSRVNFEKARKPIDISALQRNQQEIKICLSRIDQNERRFQKQQKLISDNMYNRIIAKKYKQLMNPTKPSKDALREVLRTKRLVVALEQLSDTVCNLDKHLSIMNWPVFNQFMAKQLRHLEQTSLEAKGFARKDSARYFEDQLNAERKKSERDYKIPVKAYKGVQRSQSTEVLHDEGPDELGTEQMPAGEIRLGKAHLGEEGLAADQDSNREGLQRIEELQARTKTIVDSLMDPANNMEHYTTDKFRETLKEEAVFELLVHRIFDQRQGKNEELNKKYPLMIPMKTTLEQVHETLERIGPDEFAQLRDLKATCDQLEARYIKKMFKLDFKVIDDLREEIGHESITREPFGGVMYHLIKQKAESLGRKGDDYNTFFNNQITQDLHEMPKMEKCFHSLLSKDNTVKLKRDEKIAKRKLARSQEPIRPAREATPDQEATRPVPLLQLSKQAEASFAKRGAEPAQRSSAGKPQKLQTRQTKLKEAIQRDKQTMKDNLYLLNMQRDLPEAKVRIPDTVQELFDRKFKKEMLFLELKQQVAHTNALKKKPRPGTLMRGRAVVRKSYFDYFCDPLQQSSKSTILTADVISDLSGDGEEAPLQLGEVSQQSSARKLSVEPPRVLSESSMRGKGLIAIQDTSGQQCVSIPPPSEKLLSDLRSVHPSAHATETTPYHHQSAKAATAQKPLAPSAKEGSSLPRNQREDQKSIDITASEMNELLHQVEMLKHDDSTESMTKAISKFASLGTAQQDPLLIQSFAHQSRAQDASPLPAEWARQQSPKLALQQRSLLLSSEASSAVFNEQSPVPLRRVVKQHSPQRRNISPRFQTNQVLSGTKELQSLGSAADRESEGKHLLKYPQDLQVSTRITKKRTGKSFELQKLQFQGRRETKFMERLRQDANERNRDKKKSHYHQASQMSQDQVSCQTILPVSGQEQASMNLIQSSNRELALTINENKFEGESKGRFKRLENSHGALSSNNFVNIATTQEGSSIEHHGYQSNLSSANTFKHQQNFPASIAVRTYLNNTATDVKNSLRRKTSALPTKRLDDSKRSLSKENRTSQATPALQSRLSGQPLQSLGPIHSSKEIENAKTTAKMSQTSLNECQKRFPARSNRSALEQRKKQMTTMANKESSLSMLRSDSHSKEFSMSGRQGSTRPQTSKTTMRQTGTHEAKLRSLLLNKTNKTHKSTAKFGKNVLQVKEEEIKQSIIRHERELKTFQGEYGSLSGPQNALPDRLIQFMESNDIPVYLGDKAIPKQGFTMERSQAADKIQSKSSKMRYQNFRSIWTKKNAKLSSKDRLSNGEGSESPRQKRTCVIIQAKGMLAARRKKDNSAEIVGKSTNSLMQHLNETSASAHSPKREDLQQSTADENTFQGLKEMMQAKLPVQEISLERRKISAKETVVESPLDPPQIVEQTITEESRQKSTSEVELLQFRYRSTTPQLESQSGGDFQKDPTPTNRLPGEVEQDDAKRETSSLTQLVNRHEPQIHLQLQNLCASDVRQSDGETDTNKMVLPRSFFQRSEGSHRSSRKTAHKMSASKKTRVGPHLNRFAKNFKTMPGAQSVSSSSQLIEFTSQMKQDASPLVMQRSIALEQFPNGSYIGQGERIRLGDDLCEDLGDDKIHKTVPGSITLCTPINKPVHLSEDVVGEQSIAHGLTQDIQ